MKSEPEERPLDSIAAGDDELPVSPMPAAARWTGVAFVVLLVLALLWPSPAIIVNEWIGGPPLAVDERSFLGREAPSWDVVFWAIAGLLLLAMIHTSRGDIRDSFRRCWQEMKRTWVEIGPEFRRIGWPRALSFFVAGSVLVAAIWIFADAKLLGLAELLELEHARTAIRLANRFGGGMNPPLVILWFLLAGLLYGNLRWTRIGIAMIFAAAGAGTAVQLLKYVIGRTRPELWLGPFHYAGPPSTSFPSGHTVGAFAIASVIVLGTESRLLRIIAFVIATAVAVSRVLAYRHWPSDVVASAMLGTLFGWFFTRCVMHAVKASPATGS